MKRFYLLFMILMLTGLTQAQFQFVIPNYYSPVIQGYVTTSDSIFHIGNSYYGPLPVTIKGGSLTITGGSDASAANQLLIIGRLDSSLVLSTARVDTALADTVSYSTLHTFTVPTVSHYYVYSIYCDSALYISNKGGTFTGRSFYIPAGGSFTSAPLDPTLFPTIYYQKVSGLAGTVNALLKIEGR
jgi:hypothetical protein